jgi:hypothetical protein|tara:strand:+ start:1046 stop:1246 length:201 start_codon:yes stop_codon:yes gene_type:complete
MKVGDIVEFRCPELLMEQKYGSRGVGIIIDSRDRFDKSHMFRTTSFEVQWASGEISWEHKTYLELL